MYIVPVLYSRMLFIHSIYHSLLILNSHSFPPIPLLLIGALCQLIKASYNNSMRNYYCHQAILQMKKLRHRVVN